MPIPTITSITPAVGHSGGFTLVEIIGTNFRLPPDPPVTGFVGGDFLRTVAVSIGGALTKDVRVISTTRLFCRTRQHTPGLADVVVQNLDDAGVAIAGELATFVAGYTYTRPRLDNNARSDLTRLCEQLIREFSYQTVENVSITTDTDYDPVTGDATNYIEPGPLPAIVLIGPELRENRFYSTNELTEDETSRPDPEIAIRREARVCDVVFNVIGMTDSTIQQLTLMAACESMFQRMKWIEFPRQESTPDDLVEYEIDIATGGHFRSTSGQGRNNSNLRSFTGSILVRGFPVDGLAQLQSDLIVRVDAEMIEPIVEGPEQFGDS